MDFLRTNLHNDLVEIRTELTEEIKNNVPYTSKDKFTKMIKEKILPKNITTKISLTQIINKLQKHEKEKTFNNYFNNIISNLFGTKYKFK